MQSKGFRVFPQISRHEKAALRVTMLWFCCGGRCWPHLFACPIPSSALRRGVWMAHETGTFRNTVSTCSSFTSPRVDEHPGASRWPSDVSTPGISGVVLAAARRAPVLTNRSDDQSSGVRLYMSILKSRAPISSKAEPSASHA